jgi:pimeloyl-ACP methyl ester carboxylesterase
MIHRTTTKLAICGLTLLCLAATCWAKAPGLAVQVSGHGPVVVFESGLGQAHANWDEVARALMPCLTVVTYDRPGVGQSPSPENPDAPVLAHDVAARLFATLHARDLPGPYFMVGHSLGGLYVQAFARQYPGAVSGIVLVDAASPLERPGVFVSTVPPEPGSVAAAEEKGVPSSLAELLAGPPLPPVPLVVLAATDHGDTPQREEVWRNIQRHTATLSPKGRFEIVKSGHFIQIDRPQAVIDAVLRIAEDSGASTTACARR